MLTVKTSGMHRRILPFIALSLGISALPVPRAARAQEDTQIPRSRPELPPHSLVVSGSGEARIKPDKADVTIGVVTENKSSRTAAQQNAQISQQVQEAIRKAGVQDQDIQTINYSIEPIYPEQTPGRPQSPQISGYRVYNQIRVTVRKLDAISDVLDASTAVGSNTIDGITLGVEEQQSAQDEALQKAIANARHKADVMAKAAGVNIIGIYQLTDNSGYVPGPRPLIMSAARANFGSAATPIAPGELTVTANVTIVYELSPPSKAVGSVPGRRRQTIARSTP